MSETRDSSKPPFPLHSKPSFCGASRLGSLTHDLVNTDAGLQIHTNVTERCNDIFHANSVGEHLGTV